MILVKKFGGTSLATIDTIKTCAQIVEKDYQKKHSIIVVVSAMSGETNKLLDLAYQITENNHQKKYNEQNQKEQEQEIDTLLSSGEQISSALFALHLNSIGIKSRSVTGWQVPIITDNNHTTSRITQIKNTSDALLNSLLKQDIVPVVTGFQGVSENKRITTLGRGGSDTTAVAIASALGAKECQIYTDVEGVYTSDPRLVPNAKKIDKVDFEEMLELSSLGSKVLQIRSVELASRHLIPIRVLSTFNPTKGTLITSIKKNNKGEKTKMEKYLISGIAHEKDEAQITIIGVLDRPGVASLALTTISDNAIEVDMIVQNTSSDGKKTDITFTVHRRNYQKAINALQKIKNDIKYSDIKGNDKVVKVSLVGIGMRSHAGVASKMFSAFAEKGINILTISTSEIKISVLIEEQYLELAVRTLHEVFLEQ